MSRDSQPPASVPRPHRRSLLDVAALPVADSRAPEEPREPARDNVPERAAHRAKYPSATVYLPKRAIRLIKEIGLEEERRISDILAEAVNEYLVKRGHPSLEQLRD